MSNPRPLLSTAEVAARLLLTTRQVARLVPDVLTPAAKGAGARGAYFFFEDDVEAERRRRLETSGASGSPDSPTDAPDPERVVAGTGLPASTPNQAGA